MAMNMTKAIATIMVFVCSSIGTLYAASVPSLCSKPSVEELHRQWAQHTSDETRHNTHESMYLVERLRNQISEELAKSDSHNRFQHSGNHDSSECSLEHIEGKDALQDRAYCPWYNIINHSPDRYPMDLVEAQCRLCVPANKGIATGCEVVHYNIRVLRRTDTCDANGKYIYIPGWQRVSVGCTMTYKGLPQ